MELMQEYRKRFRQSTAAEILERIKSSGIIEGRMKRSNEYGKNLFEEEIQAELERTLTRRVSDAIEVPYVGMPNNELNRQRLTGEVQRTLEDLRGGNLRGTIPPVFKTSRL
ncbi:putative glycosyl transferase [Paenibacillus sp. TCA20]|uniref:hypothetical protein n=1 Tax=Paenibacillus sp. TCA20 TaxID=1499968 RepID=UPI0004D37C6C|nr:hypothetical protein [Paenibacillus sp. TCA20]GAK42110.1 putative glycosyl transferase [Paenibacillus sp. TCA20]